MALAEGADTLALLVRRKGCDLPPCTSRLLLTRVLNSCEVVRDNNAFLQSSCVVLELHSKYARFCFDSNSSLVYYCIKFECMMVSVERFSRTSRLTSKRTFTGAGSNSAEHVARATLLQQHFPSYLCAYAHTFAALGHRVSPMDKEFHQD